MTEAEIEFVGYVQIEMSKQNAHTGEYKMEYKNECMTLRTHTHIHTATHTYTHLHAIYIMHLTKFWGTIQNYTKCVY